MTVEGITIANSAFHAVMLQGGYDPEVVNLHSWVKILGWRGNGDGINPGGNGIIEDCFIRSQDDSSYVTGKGMRRIVYWQDSNGSTFVLTPLGGDSLNSHALLVEDCTVVYSRAHWHHWAGGNLFNMRGSGGGSGGYSLTFRNIRVEDPRPTLQHFKILMEAVEPWFGADDDKRRGPGDIYGVTFQNISMAAYSVMEEPEVLWGMEDGLIYGLEFDNVCIAGDCVQNIDFFLHNEFVLEG